MLVRLLQLPIGSEDSWSGHDAPTANTAAVVARPGVPAKRNVLTRVIWSYSATPTGGRLTVADGGTTIFDVDITAGGPGSLPLCLLASSVNAALVVTLAAGGAGIVGKVNCEGIAVG